MKLSLLGICIFLLLVKAKAQQDPEFPKEFILHLKWHNGMQTNFKRGSTDVYVGGLQLIPQYTLVPKLLRAGIVLGGFYSNKKCQAIVGPTVSIKLKTLHAGPLGTVANIHANLDWLWGTQKQTLFGAGFNADIGNKFIVGISLYRDYTNNNWWIQNGLQFRLSKLKNKKQTII